jgi:hypothetical protein
VKLEEIFKDQTKIEGTIFGRVKGGFTVDIQGAVAFLPGSQVDIRPIKDVTPLMNIKQPFLILKMDRRRGNIVVSRRAVMEESRAEARGQLLDKIAEGQILGKPADRAEAIAMISMLSGREHKVVTGTTLRSKDRMQSFSVSSKVCFRALDNEEIEYYVDRYRPFDKAGAYGIQEWIGYVGIEGIEGSFYNVMGLPVQRLYCELKRF